SPLPPEGLDRVLQPVPHLAAVARHQLAPLLVEEGEGGDAQQRDAERLQLPAPPAQRRGRRIRPDPPQEQCLPGDRHRRDPRLRGDGGGRGGRGGVGHLRRGGRQRPGEEGEEERQGRPRGGPPVAPPHPTSERAPGCTRQRPAYTRSRGRRSSWLPCSPARPRSSTRIRSACRTGERRCAMAIVVRLRAICSRERWIAASVSLSTAEVASSRTRIGESFRMARASAIRCRCPPESFWP